MERELTDDEDQWGMKERAKNMHVETDPTAFEIDLQEQQQRLF